jgi:pimeloyl-ACP methyl ester carboxylesterase
MERNVRLTMRRFFYALSAAAAPSERWHPILPDPPLDPLNTAADPDHLPPWLSEADLDLYTAEFERTGFRGGLNWYRNTVRNWELLAPWSGARVLQPALYLGGEEDPVLEVPGVSRAIQAMPSLVPHLETVLLPGSGHWVQQEKAGEVNEAILTFLRQNSPN